MSEIDGYRHRCIGIIECPSRYAIVAGNDSHRNVPLYLLQDAAEAGTPWHAKRGDLLLGGGAGESAALRIAMPEAIYFYTYADWHPYIPTFPDRAQIRHAYWTLTEGFVFGDGYARRGWTPPDELETWLTCHILAFVRQEYPETWPVAWGPKPLEVDGGICRLPTAEEVAGW